MLSGALSAHPMGNFSVSHYSRLDLQSQGVRVTYILDLAEIPTLEIFQQWGVTAANSGFIQQNASKQAIVWLRNLHISVDGQELTPKLDEVRATVSDGAGGMSVLRVSMNAHLRVSPGELSFEDGNYTNRTGWKEIVIRNEPGVAIRQASQSEQDLSHELTVYPADLTLAPPQDLHASARWAALAPVTIPNHSQRASLPPTSSAEKRKVSPSTTSPVTQPVTPPARLFVETQPSAPGTVKRGDFLSRMLLKRNFSSGTILLGLLAAFALGAMHALSPGHGKTIVAAYLVGSRGTLQHALLLGFVVTFTHTVSVFLLGLGVLFFQQYVVPDQIIPVLGVISGLSILLIGAWLLYKRAHLLLQSTTHSHSHHHAHSHGEHHHHAADHHHVHNNHHVHYHAAVHTHSHGGHTHSHVMPEGRVSLGGLIALGASGGLVPCPSALILLLSSIALGHTALGLLLLTGFSSGLALVLMGIGVMVLYAKKLLPKSDLVRSHPAFRLIPVLSSVVVIVLGLLMTLAAAGVIQPMRAFS